MPLTEQDRHRQAFEIYRTGGPGRSYRTVADQMGVSIRTVRHWAKAFRWRERLVEADSKSTAPASTGSGSTLREREQLKKSARLAFKRVVESLAAGRDVSKQVANLDRVVRLITFLDGGPKGPDPNNKDDVLAFLKAIPDEVLDEICEEQKQHEAEEKGL